MKTFSIPKTPANIDWCEKNIDIRDYQIVNDKIIITYFEDMQKEDILKALPKEGVFKIQKSDKQNWWIVAHIPTGIIVEFEQGKFNETQKVINLNNFSPVNFMEIPRIMREIGDYMVENHKNLL